jgi:hypothetical protein
MDLHFRIVDQRDADLLLDRDDQFVVRVNLRIALGKGNPYIYNANAILAGGRKCALKRLNDFSATVISTIMF